MSFQDVGRNTSKKERGTSSSRSNPNRTPSRKPGHLSSDAPANVGSLKATMSLPSNDLYRISPARSADKPSDGSEPLDGVSTFRQVSDSILQYQRNVSILDNLSKSMGQKRAIKTEVENQYEVQMEVVQDLGARIAAQLKRCEEETASISSRTQATRMRNSLIKLTRDFRTVEARSKNIHSHVKQRQLIVELQQQEANEQEQLNAITEEENRQLLLRLQKEEEEVNLQIMRERQEEIQKINQGVTTVNMIYKDLATIVDEQQQDIDNVEAHMEESNQNAKYGLEQLEKANAKSDKQCVIS